MVSALPYFGRLARTLATAPLAAMPFVALPLTAQPADPAPRPFRIVRLFYLAANDTYICEHVYRIRMNVAGVHPAAARL